MTGPERRRLLLRYLAPAAFLAAVTVAVVLVRSSMRGTDGPPAPRAAASPPATASVSRTAPQAVSARARPRRRYYVIRAGDTLVAIAARLGTNAGQLLALNPGVSPTSLHIGQRIRVA